MTRLMLYCMMGLTGLLVTIGLAIPGLKSAANMKYARPEVKVLNPAPTVTPAETVGQTAAPTDNQTVLSSNLTTGVAIVTINGQTVGQFESVAQADVSKYTHPGENILRVMWMGPVSGDIKLSHAARAGEFRDVGDVFLIPAETATAGVRMETFYQ